MITAKEAREKTKQAQEKQFKEGIEYCFDSIKRYSADGRSSIILGMSGSYNYANELVFDPKSEYWNQAKDILEAQGFKVRKIECDNMSYTTISW